MEPFIIRKNKHRIVLANFTPNLLHDIILANRLVKPAEDFMAMNRENLCRKHGMEKPLNHNDFVDIERLLKNSLEQDRQYWRVNDVKCDAIYTAASYEEFADRVAAAHLRPLDRNDYKKKATRGWNQYAAKQKKHDE